MSELVPVGAGVEVLDAELVDEQVGGLDELVEMWLTARAKSRHTRTAYTGDITVWLAWCAGHGVDPLRAKKTDVERWQRQVEQTPTRRTGRVPARATLARLVSSVASFYEFLVDQDYLEVVPVRSSTRPRAPKESSTIGLSAEETVQLRAQAALAGERTRAEVDLLVVIGLRVDELAGLTVGCYGWAKGKRTLKVVGKGNKTRTLTADRDVRQAVDAWLVQLARRAGVDVAGLDPDQVLFPNAAGGRMSQRSIARMVQRLAKVAGIPSWEKISPHSLRHTAATNMLDAGVEIHVVQQILGHENVSTTERYDRARGSLERAAAGQSGYLDYLAQVAANLTEGESA